MHRQIKDKDPLIFIGIDSGDSVDLKNADDTEKEKKLPSGVSSDRANLDNNNNHSANRKAIDFTNLPAGEEIPENPDAYKYWQPEKIAPLTDPKSAIDRSGGNFSWGLNNIKLIHTKQDRSLKTP